jgi:uncharacterized protein YigE (DUF2233 family)
MIHRMRVALGLIVLCAACGARAKGVEPCGTRVEAAPGLTVETVRAAGACLTLVRLEPARYAPRLLTARAHGGSRTPGEWAHDFGLVGLINASMYAPDERSIGMLVAGEAVNRERDNGQLGAFLAFDPVDAAAPPLVLAGRDCPGFDLGDLRRRYRSIVQNYRMLDCNGQPIAWKDAKPHVSAAVGVDAAGRAVLIHSRTAVQMSPLAAALAAPELGLRSVMYVEGGPEAVLYLRAGQTAIDEGFLGGGALRIPNVLGFAPRELPR